jgi:NDP-sugar pyrophosphorylase family protein
MRPVAVLAGGLGTRLGDLATRVPKLLVDVNGRPFAEHQLDWMRDQGVTHVVYCLGHLGEQVATALGDGGRWGMRFEFVMDGPTLLGTGGALRRAMPSRANEFFVLYGDSLLTCDLPAIESAYEASGRACLMTVVRNDNRWDKSNVVFRKGEIVVYDKTARLPEMQYIDYGLGVVASRVILEYPADVPFDLVRVYQDQLTAGQLAGYDVGTRFYEIGSPAGLEETRRYLSAKAREAAVALRERSPHH